MSAIGQRFDYATYLTRRGVNWSTLKNGLVSMLHYRDALEAPYEDTEALRFGRIVHCAVFEPLEFPRRYIVMPSLSDDPRANRATREGKAAWIAWQAAWTAEHPGVPCGEVDPDAWKRILLAEKFPGKEFLTDKQYATALAIGDKLRAHKDAGKYLAAPGHFEHAIEWIDSETGLPCKARLDKLTDDGADFDLKTAETIQYRLFRAAAWRYGYFHAFAFHRMGLRALGIAEPSLRWGVIEKSRPFDCGVLVPDSEALDVAEGEVRSLLVRLKWCRENNEWPGQYTDGERVLYAPPYAFPEGDDLGGLMIGGSNDAR